MAALEGVRVVGFTHWAAGPYCLSMLGDHGADVINVEPLGGDQFRGRDSLYEGNDSAYFFGINRSKRSVALDLARREAREIARRLVATADVLVENYRVGALRRLGLGYEELSERHPRLIYCSISAWGQSGPLADRPGTDVLAQGRGGIMGVTGYPETGPVQVGTPIADFLTGYLALSGILLALREREQSGRGQKVEMCLLDGVVATLANLIPYWYKSHEPSQPVGNDHPQLMPYGSYPTADSRLLVVAGTDKFWRALCVAIDRPDLAEDERYATLEVRLRNRRELAADLSARFRQQPTAVWVERLEAAGVPCAPVNSLGEALTQPQVAHNEMLLTLEHPVAGPVLIPGVPIRLSRTPGSVSRRAPLLGEHTREVLLELGYTEGEIEGLTEAGVIK